jgi:hypothetical protein
LRHQWLYHTPLHIERSPDFAGVIEMACLIVKRCVHGHAGVIARLLEHGDEPPIPLTRLVAPTLRREHDIQHRRHGPIKQIAGAAGRLHGARQRTGYIDGFRQSALGPK